MKWIRIDDRLPETENVVIVHTIDGYTQVAYIENSTHTWVGIGYYRAPKVTHWMPLPSPPLAG